MYNPESNIAYSVLFHNVLILQKRTKLCGSFRRAAPFMKQLLNKKILESCKRKRSNDIFLHMVSFC